MPSAATLHVSDANFEKEVLQSSEPVLVDFFAEWCGPCKAMAPALEQVAAEMKGKVKIAKLDVDQNPEITQRYAIQAMPTLLIFKGGQRSPSASARWCRRSICRTGSTARSEPHIQPRWISRPRERSRGLCALSGGAGRRRSPPQQPQRHHRDQPLDGHHLHCPARAQPLEQQPACQWPTIDEPMKMDSTPAARPRMSGGAMW